MAKLEFKIDKRAIKGGVTTLCKTLKMIVNIERLASYQEGEEKGQHKMLSKLLKLLKLLDKLPPEQIAEFSGVPLEKIKAMQEDAKS